MNSNPRSRQTGASMISMILTLLVILLAVYSSLNLLKNEKTTGPTSLNSSNIERSSANQNGSAAKSPYPFAAMNKAENCVKLSARIADAKNRGVDHFKLTEQHIKECR